MTDQILEPSAWLRQACIDRIKDFEPLFDRMVRDGIKVVVVFLTEPGEGESWVEWDHSCDRCGGDVGDGVYVGRQDVFGRERNSGEQLKVVINYGLCEECALKEQPEAVAKERKLHGRG